MDMSQANQVMKPRRNSPPMTKTIAIEAATDAMTGHSSGAAMAMPTAESRTPDVAAMGASGRLPCNGRVTAA